MSVDEALALLAVAVGLAALIGASTGLVVVNAPPLVVGLVMFCAVPLGALGAQTHLRVFTPSVRPPVRRTVAADRVRYEVEGTASVVGLGIVVWLMVLLIDGAVTVWVSPWTVPMGTFGLLYTLGAVDAIRRIRPRVTLTIGLHQVVVHRRWFPGRVRVHRIGAERLVRAVAVGRGEGTAMLILELEDRRGIHGLEGPTALVEELADEVTQIVLRPRSRVAEGPTSLAALLDRADSASPKPY